jgi:carbon monoxide dehydrogenase subunit G
MISLRTTSRLGLLAQVSLCMALWTPVLNVGAAIQDEPEVVQVEASKTGEAVVVDAKFSVNAPLALVWQVLTDYDHSASFIGGLDESRVLVRSENHLEVMQKGSGWIGPFKMSFESVRGVNLTPMTEIHSYIISGTLKKSNGHAVLRADGGAVTVTYHNEIVAGVWVPPGVGSAFIAQQIKKQFQDLRAEVLRRQAVSEK